MLRIEDVEIELKLCDVAGPASTEAISAAESALKVQFPGSYRWFLANFGAALCDGFRIAGLFEGDFEEEPPLWTHVVSRTSLLRDAARGNIPCSYVAISDDGGDYTYYLDTSKMSDEAECPVVVLGPGVDDVIVASDFLDFLKRSFDNSLFP